MCFENRWTELYEEAFLIFSGILIVYGNKDKKHGIVAPAGHYYQFHAERPG